MTYPAKKSRKPSAPPVSFLDGRVVLRPGDCLDVLDDMDENSVDAVVCDPPDAWAAFLISADLKEAA